MTVTLDIQQTTTAFKLLSDPTRFRVLSALFQRPGMCVNDVAEEVGISHSAASHQLAKLEAHGIVSCCRDGRTMCYRVCRTVFTKKLKQAMHVFV